MTAAVAQTDLDRIAPYPLTEKDVTAPAMSRHLAVHALRALRIDVPDLSAAWVAAGSPTDGAEVDAYRAAANAATAQGALALVLADLPHPKARQVARDIWSLLEGQPEDVADELAELLSEIGIDPEQVA